MLFRKIHNLPIKISTLLLVSVAILLFNRTAVFAEPERSNDYMNLLEDELQYFYKMKHYKEISIILYDELDSHPSKTLQLLEYINQHKKIFNYTRDSGPLTLVLDNSLKWPVSVKVDDSPSFKIKGFSSKNVQLTPGYHDIVCFSDLSNYLEEIVIPAISPPERKSSDKTYVILNIGKLNSYRLSDFNQRYELRAGSECTRGCPKLLRQPRCFWINCTELFPLPDKRKHFGRLLPWEVKPPVSSIFRIINKNQPPAVQPAEEPLFLLQ